jgi:flagellin
MGFRINTNVSSLQAQRSIGKTTQEQETSFQKLSSGQRINKASDDAAGLAISEKLKAEIRSARQADRNANDGISMVQVAEGGLNESQAILTRLRELAIQSASDTVGDKEREFTNMEYQNLISELDRISKSTEFNGKKLLDGSAGTLDFQIGTKSSPDTNVISYDAGSVNASTSELGVEGLNVVSKEDAQSSLDTLDQAIEKLSGQRAFLGGLQNRLTSTSNNLQVGIEGMSAANSRIRDVDYAEETAKQAKNQILSAAGTSVLAQANMSSQAALKLIG